MCASVGVCLKATTLHYRARLDLPNTRDVISHMGFCLTFPYTVESVCEWGGFLFVV